MAKTINIQKELKKKNNSLKNELGSLLTDDSWSEDDGGFVTSFTPALDDCSLGDTTNTPLPSEEKKGKASATPVKPQSKKKKKTVTTKDNQSYRVIVESSDSNFNFSIGTTSLNGEIVGKMLLALNSFSGKEQSLLLEVLELCDYGRKKDVEVLFADLKTKTNLRGSAFTSFMNYLKDKEIVSVKEGYRENTKYVRFFISVNLKMLFSTQN